MSRPLPSPASQSAANSLTNLANLSAIENDIVADLMGSVDDTLRGGGEDQPAAKRAKTRGGDVMDLPPPLPEEATATPARVAGASVLASLGESVPALPSIETGADHDYLLQNLVHATQVTSPLSAPPIKTEEGEVKPEKEEDKPPRKERSLGKLCENFMGLFADVPVDDHNNGTVIEICEIASRMRVQRRRIYDVINILEAIDVVTRVKKNTYQWHGLEGLHAFFANMQKEALAERSSATAVAVAAATGVETGADDMILTPAKSSATGHKSKGMAMICKKLLEMYLVTGRTEIGLAEAAEEVLGALSPAEEADPETRAKVMKTKVRRMYDIANVLATLGILTKENVGSTSVSNKPSFRWVYPVAPGELGNYIPPPPAPSMVAEMMETAAAAAALGNSLPDPVMAPQELMNTGETLEV